MGDTKRFKVGLNKDIYIERETIAIVLFSEMFTNLMTKFEFLELYLNISYY